jgi:hypothetical protein
MDTISIAQLDYTVEVIREIIKRWPRQYGNSTAQWVSDGDDMADLSSATIYISNDDALTHIIDYWVSTTLRYFTMRWPNDYVRFNLTNLAHHDAFVASLSDWLEYGSRPYYVQK